MASLHGALGNAIHRARPRRGTHPKRQKGGRAEDPCTSQTENQHEASPSWTLKTAIFRTIFRGPASGQSEREVRGKSHLAAHFQSLPAAARTIPPAGCVRRQILRERDRGWH